MRVKSTTHVPRICTVQISFSVHRKPFHFSNRFSIGSCGEEIKSWSDFGISTEMEKRTPRNQAVEIESSIAVELDDSTAAAISICTIQSPLQSVLHRTWNPFIAADFFWRYNVWYNRSNFQYHLWPKGLGFFIDQSSWTWMREREKLKREPRQMRNRNQVRN